MKICDFTIPELRFLDRNCNFTDDEEILFNLRARNIPLEECAELMNLSVSAVKHKSQKLNMKIHKVMNL